MNELKIFNYEDNTVRTVEKGGEIWWVLKDVCKVLEMDTTGCNKIAARLEEDEWNQIPLTDSLGREQETYIVNESGLYNIILRSDKPKAKPFRKWVTSEVLPSIRKHGMYAVDELIANPDLAIAALTALKEERERNKAMQTTIAVQNQQIAELKPKASYYDVVLNCKDLLSTTEIAKDYGKSARWLNDMLHKLHVQFKQSGIWLLYQKYAEEGYTSTKTHSYPGNDGEVHSRVHTYWTQKGRLFIYELMKSLNIFPTIEADDKEKD